ncbi:hypothetical protein LTR37_013954 [Vermiconidia calcicola]|uniref:Uncharacterized protein n=1 Tax=Vermiconidia calcicola TaxID=1690605 RepID=A0ACC3MW47_9PEZI|nr:hypothetical protein LTR37_013954 [Vermiconidia calcicola]
MGCCQSRDRSSDDAPDIVASNNAAAIPHGSSRAAINQPSRSVSNVGSIGGSSITHNARPNQPVRPPTPITSSPEHVSNQPPPWTRRQLEKEREAFFDTRVSGNDEIWKALRLVCEEIRKDNLAEAQGILDALNITCPNGRIARGRGRNRIKGGLYDERGELYDIPSWVLTDPQDIIENDEKDVEAGAAEDGENNVDETGEARPRSEKGKGRAEDIGEVIKLRARLSDRGTDIIVSTGTKQKVADIVRAVQAQIGKKRLRLMYLGKALNERLTLEENGWQQGHVVNAMVFEGDEGILSKKASSK